MQIYSTLYSAAVRPMQCTLGELTHRLVRRRCLVSSCSETRRLLPDLLPGVVTGPALARAASFEDSARQEIHHVARTARVAGDGGTGTGTVAATGRQNPSLPHGHRGWVLCGEVTHAVVHQRRGLKRMELGLVRGFTNDW
jgi:hypothetical protein